MDRVQSVLRNSVHPHGRGDNSGLFCTFLGEFRFTPTGVGTTGDDAQREGRVDRFTPTGVGTTNATPCEVCAT